MKNDGIYYTICRIEFVYLSHRYRQKAVVFGYKAKKKLQRNKNKKKKN